MKPNQILKKVGIGLVSLCCMINFASGETGDEIYPKRILRVTGDDQQRQLEIPVAHYKNAEGKEIVLIGVVHYGDKEYYQKLNEYFNTFDYLFFELITNQEYLDLLQLKIKQKKGLLEEDVSTEELEEEEVRLRPKTDYSFLNAIGKGILHVISQLKIHSQVEEIDYAKENFVHADMMADELVNAYKENDGSGFLELIIPSITAGVMMENDQSSDQIGIALALALKDYKSLKMLIIDLLHDSVNHTLYDDSILINGRNKVCMDKVDEYLKDDKIRKIGIFYGCAHLPAFHQDVLDRGYQLQKVEWWPGMTSSVKEK